MGREEVLVKIWLHILTRLLLVLLASGNNLSRRVTFACSFTFQLGIFLIWFWYRAYSPPVTRLYSVPN
ncbi:hypothetical protein B0J11DRAFT_528262 [Dendryphion nanum]|uniref:Uncharacterized protein n=1 Tax=Dendryphion nanum TaxID=256645 RepID=A0A9P9ILZ7_9PLEO|nr:hypothetical protein B0J11DRAFT_528262 [Dendryphion nanum]